MAGLSITIRVAVTPHTPETLAEELTRIIEDHRASGREGVVPALLAEAIVAGMVGRSILLVD